MKKYAIHPGEVRSQNDGDIHHISAPRLAELYGLKRNEWFEWDARSSLGLEWSLYTHLYPRSDGDYSLPKDEK